MSCCICLEDLNSPLSLPCGHIFCCECLRRAVQAIQPYSTLHACPTCRALYSIAPLDLSTIPFHLRPHINSSVRKLYLDLPSKDANSDSETSSLNPATSDSSQALSLEVARLRAEVEALRYNCSMWRRRAEVHSLSTAGFLELWRTTREQLTRTCRERDTIQRNYLELNHNFHRQHSAFQALVSTTMPLHHSGSPSSLLQPQPFVNPLASDLRQSTIAPPLGSCPTGQGVRKRLRQDEDDDVINPRPAKIPRH